VRRLSGVGGLENVPGILCVGLLVLLAVVVCRANEAQMSNLQEKIIGLLSVVAGFYIARGRQGGPGA